MSRHASLVRLGQAALTLDVFVICILVFGPFQGAEAHFGLTDKEAHALAFYSLTWLSLLSAPRMRKVDIVLILMAFGAFIEVVQSLIGRDGDLFDWLADAVGIACAYLPMLGEKIRIGARNGRSARIKSQISNELNKVA